MEDGDGNINLKNLSLHQANNEEEGAYNLTLLNTVIPQVINEIYIELSSLQCTLL
jgi:hypothetical protein